MDEEAAMRYRSMQYQSYYSEIKSPINIALRMEKWNKNTRTGYEDATFLNSLPFPKGAE